MSNVARAADEAGLLPADYAVADTCAKAFVAELREKFASWPGPEPLVLKWSVDGTGVDAGRFDIRSVKDIDDRRVDIYQATYNQIVGITVMLRKYGFRIERSLS